MTAGKPLAVTWSLIHSMISAEERDKTETQLSSEGPPKTLPHPPAGRIFSGRFLAVAPETIVAYEPMNRSPPSPADAPFRPRLWSSQLDAEAATECPPGQPATHCPQKRLGRQTRPPNRPFRVRAILWFDAQWQTPKHHRVRVTQRLKAA